MPIYEYYCPDNHTVYRFFARRSGLDKKVPRCPADPAWRMEKRLSSFAIVGVTPKAKKKMPEGGGPDADDPRMEAAMMELEREMSGMDDDNPDPRQLGRLMRKMTELTGERGDERMEEMIRRLEAGEDPDKMEEEYGDVLDEGMGDGDGGAPGGADDGEAGSLGEMRRVMARWRRARREAEPSVDPELYEMEEWLGKAPRKKG